MRVLASLVIAVIVATASMGAQTTPNAPQVSTPARTAAPEGRDWSFYASSYSYIVPDGGSYLQPTVTADRGRLHLEARYNYEALETGSVWVGCNFSGGGQLAWEFTPMLAGVLGKNSGAAPGFS